MEANDVKDFIQIAKPIVDPLVATLIKPKLERLEKWLRRPKSGTKVDFHEQKFREYMTRSLEKFSSINVLVFPNRQLDLRSIYQPLTLVSSSDRTSTTIDNVQSSFFESYQRILISDTAGMGKSTLLKWMGLSLIKQSLSVPVLIELKRLTAQHTIVDELFHQINPIDESFSKDFIFRLLELGGFTILLDGFDEIQPTHREAVIRNIKDFVSKTSDNWFALTSRPESSLTAFGDFQGFVIQPLKPNESYSLIRRYDSLSTNRVADQLIADVTNRNPQVREFLGNPFLVSLLYKTYTYNKDIPSKKSSFYDEVYGALYKHHDLSKDGLRRNKKSGLDIQDFRQVLRQLAFDTAKIGRVEYSEQELVDYLLNVQSKLPGISFKVTDLIEDLELNVPLFARDGSVLKWAHKSLQDYFASEYIATSKEKERILELIHQSQKESYLNILDFTYEQDYATFRKVIISKVLDNYIAYCNSSYRACKNIPKGAIRDRQGFNFGRDLGCYVSDMETDWKGASQLFAGVFRARPALMMTTAPSKGLSAVRMFARTFDDRIIDILRIKGEDLFRTVQRTIRPDSFLAKKLPLNAPVHMNDDPNNLMNGEGRFAMFTSLALEDAPIDTLSPTILDYDKCRTFVEKLEREGRYDAKLDPLSGI